MIDGQLKSHCRRRPLQMFPLLSLWNFQQVISKQMSQHKLLELSARNIIFYKLPSLQILPFSGIKFLSHFTTHGARPT
jgi:hypothetical protein